MAITFNKNNNRRRYEIIGGAALAVILVLGLIWWGFLRKPAEAPPVSTTAAAVSLNKLKINYSILDSDALKSLKPLPQIPALETTEIGRSNPFVPY